MQTNGLVCRDYLRNVCQRTNGDCRFEHPPRVVSNAVQSRDPSQNNQNMNNMNPNRNPDMSSQQDKISVCRDFARGSCPRTHCRFLHLTPSEVRDYATNGNLPERILIARSNGLKMQSADVEALNGAIPLCRDYLKGICLRRETCRYLHLNNISAPLSPSGRSSSNHSMYSSSNARFEQDLDESPPLIKRMKATSSGVFEIQSPDEPLQPQHTPNETFHCVPSGRVSANRHNAPNNTSSGHLIGSRRRRSSVSGLSPAGDHYDPFSNSPPFPSPSGSTTSGGSSAGGHSRSLSNRRRITNSNSNRPCSTCLGCNNLQVENRSLRLKVIELEKQVNNLSTTNDVLLTQNAKLRTNKVVPFQNNANPQQQQTPQQQQQPVNPPPVQPVQQPTPVSIHCGYPSAAVTNSNNINYNNLTMPNFGLNYGSQSNEAPPPPPPVIVPNNMGGYSTNISSTFNANREHNGNSTQLPTQNHNQTHNVLQPQQHVQTAIQVPTGAAVGAVLTTHPRNPIATTVANVNAAVPYFITQLTPNFTPLNGTHAAAASLNPSAVQSAGQAVAAAPSGSIRAAILPHPANQVVAAAQPVAIAGSGHYTPTFLLPHVPTTTVNPVSANSANPQQLTVTTLSLTPLAAAAGYTGQLYNLRPASGTTYHLTPASAQTVCINALQAAPNMSPVVVAHTPSTLAAAAAAQSVGSGPTAVFQTVQAIQASSRISSPHN